MLKKYILALFLFFMIVVIGNIISLDAKYDLGYIKQVYNSNLEKSKYTIKEILSEENSCSIKVYYPETNYKLLNESISNYINSNLEEFKKEVSVINKDEIDFKFNYDITFNSYEYNDYISIVLDITYYTGGAHPIEIIKSFNYNIKGNKMVTIEDLTNMNENILSILSERTYKILSKHERIEKYSDENFLTNGTSANIKNFSEFAFTKDGLIIFFNKYQVAPYVAGSFEVKLPYDVLKLNI